MILHASLERLAARIGCVKQQWAAATIKSSSLPPLEPTGISWLGIKDPDSKESMPDDGFSESVYVILVQSLDSLTR